MPVFISQNIICHLHAVISVRILFSDKIILILIMITAVNLEILPRNDSCFLRRNDLTLNDFLSTIVNFLDMSLICDLFKPVRVCFLISYMRDSKSI